MHMYAHTNKDEDHGMTRDGTVPKSELDLLCHLEETLGPLGS